ncbi:MAG: type II toxin-antitoxin system VapC family toxin [Acidobacteria bacterium]|nr:type II toxin-antitoxin system VapC family toxin [Acidobacteriota bacterium]
MLITTATDAPLLLDTHVWIWLLDGVKGRLSANCLTAMRRAARESQVWIAAITVWEVATLEAKGKITLSMDCRAWVEAGLRAPGVRFADLTPSIAIDSASLAGPLHGDPADRILVATARQLKAALVTRNAAILEYSTLGHVNALDAGR